MMDSSISLSGETLFLRQAPLALEHQSPAWSLRGATRPVRPCSLKLACTISLPKPPVSLNPFAEARTSAGNSQGSKPCRGDTQEQVEEEKKEREEEANAVPMEACSSPLPSVKNEGSPCVYAVRKGKTSGDRSTPRWVNPFIPEEERDGVEEEEDDPDGDNLHKYYEDFSFQLHGDSQVMAQGLVEPARHHGAETVGTRRNMWSQERGVSKELEKHVQQGHEVRPACESRGTPMLIDYTECQWASSGDSDGRHLNTLLAPVTETVLPCTLRKTHGDLENLVDIVSDSSCNSSDGVLVTFSSIYNKSNNAVPAAPFDLDSPIEPSHGTSSLSQDGSNSSPYWTPQDPDPNCNYQLDSGDVPSPQTSDLANVLHTQAQLTAPSQNYYKLVTCDLSTQSSPSPAWSSVTSCSESRSQSSPTPPPPTEYFLFRQVDNVSTQAHLEEEAGKSLQTKTADQLDDPAIDENLRKRWTKGRTSLIRSCDTTTASAKNLLSPGLPPIPRVPSCPGKLTTDATGQQVTSFVEIANSKRGLREMASPRTSPKDQVSQDLSGPGNSGGEEPPLCLATPTSPPFQMPPGCLDEDNLPSTSRTERPGPSSSLGMLRFSKDQRPTSLPIQPFVLQLSTGPQEKQPLGSLLNQYLKCGTHKGKGKAKAKTGANAVPNYLRPSPLGGYSSALHLEAASSSDTCSTCTPSPMTLPHSLPLEAQHQHPSSPGESHHHLGKGKRTSPANSVRPRASKASPEESHLSLEFHGKDSRSSSPHSGANPSPRACNFSPSPRPPPRLIVQHSPDHKSPKAMDSFQSLALSSCGTENQGAENAPSWDISQRVFRSPAVTSVTCLNTPSCLVSGPMEKPGAHCNTSRALCAPAIFWPGTSNTGFQVRQPLPRPHLQQGDSSYVSDRPPEEFCLSPDASSESLSIDLLQKKALLNAVSSAVEVIVNYFNHPSGYPDDMLQLGNSTLSPTIAQLVLNQLCPAIRDILQDGLRSYKLDLIVGQRRNQPWDVVLASTQPGPTTRVLHSLVSVVSKCSQLTKHSMRFNAFVMGLLNLRALEFWLNHLNTCVDVLRPLYHHWGMVPLWPGPCRSHLHEVLSLLEPLATFPFDLHLLSEARLLKRKTSLLAQSAYSSLQMSSVSTNHQPAMGQREEQTRNKSRGRQGSLHTVLPSPQALMQYISIGQHSNTKSVTSPNKSNNKPPGGSSVLDSATAAWWLQQPSVVEGVMAPSHDTQEANLRQQREEERGRMMPRTDGVQEEEDKFPQELRWARLFGSKVCAVTRENKQQSLTRNQKNRLPSQWLSLDGSSLEILAQSVWSGWHQETLSNPNHSTNTTLRGQR